MKLFRRTAGVLTILAALSIFTINAYADEGGYRFDDLTGPSGISYQWMVVNGLGNGANTFGANHYISMDISADLVTSDQEEGIYVLSGTPDDEHIENRELSTLFLVLGEGEGDFSFSFRSPTNITEALAEAITEDINLGSDTGASSARYHTEKTAYGTYIDENGYAWVDYKFHIEAQRGSTSTYDTVKQYFNFHQNPAERSSQTKHMPVVIANVNTGSAVDEALELRMSLRDTNTNGNIVAYKRDTWNANTAKTTESRQWILVPVDDINNRNMNYYLTTEIANHTSIRYGAEDSSNHWLTPRRWKFDLPRYIGTTNVPRNFYLDPLSQAAPGLVTVYSRSYNMGEENKRPLGIGVYDVDDPREGLWSLVFNNNVLFCKEIGKYYEAGDSSYNRIEITAFQTNPASQTFYEDIAEKTGSKVSNIAMPSSFTTSSVSRVSPTSEALEYFTINHAIPGNIDTSDTEGMLPLHITFNIPVTRIKDYNWWNNMIDEWRRSGEIAEIFAQNLHIYAMADDKNIWNMSQELTEKGVYDSQVKVFLDEERGKATADNDMGVVTVSFMILLMNGTRDGERPEMSIVTDSSTTGAAQEYIVIRDGSEDDKRWKMQFFIAPAGYQNNETDDDDDDEKQEDSNSVSGGGGGGGCNSGAGLAFVIIPGLAMLAIIKKIKFNRRDII